MGNRRISFKNKISEADSTDREWKYIEDFRNNLLGGINYFKALFNDEYSGKIINSLIRIQVELSLVNNVLKIN